MDQFPDYKPYPAKTRQEQEAIIIAQLEFIRTRGDASPAEIQEFTQQKLRESGLITE